MPLDITALAQGSRSGSEFEARVLAALEREVGFEVAFFSMKGSEATPTVRGLDGGLIRLAVAGGAAYEQELLPVKRAALARRGVAVDTQVLGSEHVRQQRYFREVAARVNGKHSLMAYLPWGEETFAAIMLGRTQRDFSAGEIRYLEDLLPALGVARRAFALAAPCPPRPLDRATWLERLGIARERVLGSVPTAHGVLSVRDRAGFREMVLGEGTTETVWTRAALSDPSSSGWPYLDFFHLSAALAQERRRALFIGLGGGVAPRQFARTYPGIAIDVVEHESAVVELARRFFAFDEIPGVAVHIADGAEFVARAPTGHFDVAVIDAYDGPRLDSVFTTEAFFRELGRVLTPGGALAINVIATLERGGAARRVVAAAKAAFRDVRLVPVVDVDDDFDRTALRNVVVVAARPLDGG